MRTYRLQNMNKVIGNIFGLLLAVFVLISCTKKTAYEQYKNTVERELSSEQRVDSLFFGVYLGMSSKEFYGHCWEMNKEGLFTNGENNSTVLYKLNNGELSYPASMNFYPAFFKDEIYQMSASFEYDAWAPWNKHLHTDSLQPRVLELYKKWYSEGNPFISMKDEKRGTIYVKVDGNRRIIIGRYDERRVKVDYTDLWVENKMNDDVL